MKLMIVPTDPPFWLLRWVVEQSDTTTVMMIKQPGGLCNTQEMNDLASYP